MKQPNVLILIKDRLTVEVGAAVNEDSFVRQGLDKVAAPGVLIEDSSPGVVFGHELCSSDRVTDAGGPGFRFMSGLKSALENKHCDENGEKAANGKVQTAEERRW